MLFLIIWILGAVASFAVNGYLRGYSDKRFNTNQGITENPPWIIGQIGCLFWPVQLVGTLIWAINHLAYAKGKDDGMAVNTELSQLRKFANDFRTAESETFRLMLENNIDPENLDAQTTRALTARAIEWDMEEEAAQRREAKGLEVTRKPRDYKLDMSKSHPLPKKKTDDLFEVLDRKGVVVHSDDYDEYWDRKKDEGDLVL